jgi:hypothetical protein
MSAFKSLTSQDVIITPFVVNKSFSFVGSASLNEDNVFIERLIGKNITSSFEITTELTTGTTASSGLFSSSYYQRDIYNSVKQLYYTNELPNFEGINIITDLNGNIVESNVNTNIHSRFDNYLNSTLYYPSQSRYFPTGANSIVNILSVSSKLYGDYINPNTFALNVNTGANEKFIDNGEGYIINPLTNDVHGTISYQHGIIVITSGLDDEYVFTTTSDITCSFQSSRTIYETQYKCTLRENEFNYTLNPSVISGSDFTNPLNSSCSIDIRGQVYDFITGSVWTPYVTTVGLYNETNQLLAVAKLSQPLPTSRTTDMSILINLDM